MKKYILSLMAALVVFSVLAGCTGKPEPTPTPDNKPGSVEVGLDDLDLSDMSDDDHQTEGDFGDIDVSFKDPDNSDGIVITPRETSSPVSSTPSTTPKSSPPPTQNPTSTPVQTPAPTTTPVAVPTPEPTADPDVDIDTDTKGGVDIDVDLSSQGSIDIDIAPAGKDQNPNEADGSMRFGDIVVTPKDPDMNVVITPREPK